MSATAPGSPGRVLLLLRHGESIGNAALAAGHNDPALALGPAVWPLTAQGREEARQAAGWLREALNGGLVPPLAAVLTSPMRRAVETVALAVGAEPLVSAPVLVEQLRERTWGSYFDGVSAQGQLERMHQAAEEARSDPWGWRPPGGESLSDVRDRVRRWLVSWLRTAPVGTTIACTHGEFLYTFRTIVEADPARSALSGGRQRVVNAGWLGYHGLADPGEVLERLDVDYAAAAAQWHRIEPAAATLKALRREAMQPEDAVGPSGPDGAPTAAVGGTAR